MTQYTIGEIYRQQLLKNSKGQPYSQKASVSNALKGHPHKVVQTAYGPAKVFTKATIDAINKKWS